MGGHKGDKCFSKYPKNALEWWKAKQQGINDVDKTGGKLSDIHKWLKANKTQMSLAEILKECHCQYIRDVTTSHNTNNQYFNEKGFE